MSNQNLTFIPGQRWLSDAESELGLGTVAECDERMVRILFGATGEERLYARRGEPLRRVAFAAGERIVDRDGRELIVVEAREAAGLLTYRCEDLDGALSEVEEGALDDHLRLNHPQERLLAGRFDRDDWFTLRYESRLRGAEEARSPVLGLVGARVSPIPHQLYIADQVAGRLAPRVLLADEVGLGKTIEAGLILHRQLLTGRARRVLVVVPEALLHQWLVEMLRRFNLRFSLFDAERFAEADADNPFHDAQRVLCSLEYLTSDPQAARAALAGEWDLLVVDEAHHLHWSPEETGLEYDLVEALAGVTPGVLLLTATPEQLGRAGHFGRLRLLDPHRFPDYETFLAEERDYEPVAALVAKLVEGEALDGAEQERIAPLLAEVGEAPEALVDRLVDRHGTGRVLYRNTRSAIRGFPERRPNPHPLPPPAGEGEEDPRLEWLIGLLRELRPEKVLLICAEAATAAALREELKRREGTHAALFHEGMEIVERDRAAAYFADPGGSQLLICSEIGSEGRNFQFAHHLVLFDLPLEPDLVEQRIGRLDRIGQRHAVEIHVPYLEGGADEVLYRWYAEGLGLFRAPCPAAGAVFERQHEALAAALADPAKADALVGEAAELTARLNAELEAGRDRLLELHSHRPEASAELVAALAERDGDRGLIHYMERYWDAYGVEHDPGPGGSTVLHPGDHMLHHHFPGLPEEGATVTFDRHDALAHEDREFLTWEHPMVRGAMELLTGGELGSTAVTLIKDKRIKPGTLLLEQIYLAECPAPPELEIGRFLPPTALRLLLDPTGRDWAALLGHGQLKGESLSRNRDLGEKVIESQAPLIRKLLERGEALAREAAAPVETAAREAMERLLGEELARLRALAEIGGGVRPEELELLEARRELIARHLEKTHLHLDAVRVIVAH